MTITTSGTEIPTEINNNDIVNGSAKGKELEACAIDVPTATQNENDAPPVGQKKKPPRTGWRRYIGMIMAFSASLNFSFGVLFAKLLQNYGYTGNCNSFWRYIGVSVPAVPLLLYYELGCNSPKNPKPQTGPRTSIPVSTSQISILSKDSEASGEEDAQQPEKSQRYSTFDTIWPISDPAKRKLAFFVFLRGFFAATAVVLRYYALDYLPIGDTSVITYSTPVLVTILAHFFLRERAGVISFIIAFTTLVGVVIVSKPPMLTGSDSFTSDSLKGTAFAVSSLACASIQIILTRTVRSVHFALLTVTVGYIGLTLAGMLLIILQDFEYPQEWPKEGFYVLGLTGTSFLGQMSIILGLKFEQAGPVALIRTSDCVIGFLLQYIFMNVVPEWTSAVGGAIVIAGVLVTASRKFLQELPKDNPTRKRFRWLI